MEYSRNLEKLAERFMAKTRSTKDHQQYKWETALFVYHTGWDHLLFWLLENEEFNECVAVLMCLFTFGFIIDLYYNSQ